MPTKKMLEIREFLNLPGYHSLGAIYTTVNRYVREDDSSEEDIGLDVWSQLMISDCGRTVDISLDFNTKEEGENTLHKLNVMINTMTQVRDQLKPLVKTLKAKS